MKFLAFAGQHQLSSYNVAVCVEGGVTAMLEASDEQFLVFS